MQPTTKPVDKDARLLGLALLHGYLEAEDLETAARKDPRPSAILASLREAGILDEPCLQGLEQSLEDLGSDPSLPTGTTSSTRAVPCFEPELTGDGAGGGTSQGRALDSQAEDGFEQLIFRKLTIARWKQYRHLRFIGEGGMGRIFKAVDPDLNRTVALKFLRGQDPGQLRRFLFEAQAQALVEHPNICQVHEVSEWQGQHYISMQYVNGPTLLKVRDELAPAQKLELMETVARAVHSAHRRGLIHRDLKPTNILVERDEAGGVKPFVLDFGLARDTQTRDFTASGLVVGTTAYMAPEQARGEAHHIDRRTDVYSLGATLFELFAGCPPFGDAKGLDCLRLVVEEEPPPLRRFAPGLHPDLETIVSKCLEKDPSRRYDDALALAEDLRRFREGDPILARPATLLYRLEKFARKNRALVAVSGLAVVALLVLTGVAAYARLNATARELAAQHYSQEAERIEAMLGYARRLPVQNIEPHLARARERLRRLQEEVKASGRTASASGAYAVGRAHLAFGEVERALPLLQQAESQGLRTPELASALGQSYAFIYQRELERARRMNVEGPQAVQAREARIRQVEHQWRDPALQQLRIAKPGSLDSQEALEAQVDWYEGRMDAALEKVRSAISKDPSDYQAKGLEGELLLAQARQEKDKGQSRRALELLQTASKRFVEALAVAPSDTSLWLGEAKVQVEMLRNSESEPFMDRAILRCREIAHTCLMIRPSDPRPLAQVAMAVYWSDDRPSSRGARMESMLREGVRLTEQVLDILPADYDAHYARIGLLESLVIRERDRGADPTQTLELVVAATKKALALHPGDWALIAVGTEVAKTKMVWEGQSGRGVEPGFQFAVALAEDLMRHNPTHPIAHLRMAQVHVERADFNCRNGIDPRASVEKAQEFLESARKLNLDSGSFLTTLGDTWLIRAQYAFAVGADPKPDLLQALDSYQRRVDGQSTTRGSFGNLAEACFYMAVLSARDSRDPGGWLNRAETAIQKGLLLDDYHWLHQLRGQCAWVRARWLLASKQDPAPDFAKSLTELRAASEKAHTASADRWIAKVLLDRAQYLTQSRGDVADGLRAVQKSLAADPSSGESEFLMGRLKLEAAGSASPGPAAKLRDEAQVHLQRAIQLNGTFEARKSRLRSAKESIRSLDP